MDLGRTRRRRLFRINHSRQRGVVDHHGIGGILRGVPILGDHHCNAIADMAHFANGESRWAVLISGGLKPQGNPPTLSAARSGPYKPQ
ncbi:MAG: hypothetical protein R2867_09855 [Caldilineaceae bacterium]